MSDVAMRAPSTYTLLRLGRVSNLPTVWTNVIAGATIANATANVAGLAVVFTMWGKSQNRPPVPSDASTAPEPGGGLSNTAARPSTPDELVDARREAQ